jgi:predicted O-methyltransferase YrrM
MIFIDADKINYLNYLDWAEENIRPGGLIIGDNTLLFDAVFQEKLPKGIVEAARQAMRTFNQRLAEPDKYHSIMLPTKEGMTIAIKNY